MRGAVSDAAREGSQESCRQSGLAHQRFGDKESLVASLRSIIRARGMAARGSRHREGLQIQQSSESRSSACLISWRGPSRIIGVSLACRRAGNAVAREPGDDEFVD